MHKIAFFDFDNTIYDGYTYEDYLHYIQDNKLVDTDLRCLKQEILKSTKEYNKLVKKLADLVASSLTEFNQKQFEEYTKFSCSKTKIRNWVQPVINYLKTNGFKTVLVTASFLEMILNSQEKLKFDKLLCSEFEVIDNRFTGKIKFLLNEEKKVEALENEIGQNQSFSLAFGDSMGDAPMLNRVDLAFLVKAYDNEIEKKAKSCGWIVSDDPDIIIQNIKKYYERACL